MEEDEPVIVINELHKGFGQQKVLNGISLRVAPSETVAVLGRSGTGKSVLLKLLIGLQKPDSGSICIHGKDVSNFSTKQWNEIRVKIGFLFQQAALYDSLTIEENVVFPLARHTSMSGDERRQKARELLNSVGLNEQDLEKAPSEISGGMQKRVGLARALALEPDILLFDEPTAGLDPITAAEISQLILDLKKERGLTAVVVTHDLRGARTLADRAVLLNEGKIVAEGNLDELEHSEEAFVKQFFE